MRIPPAFAISAIAAVAACRPMTDVRLGCEAEIRSLDGPILEVKFVEALRVRGCGETELRSQVGANLSSLEAVLGRVGVVKTEPLITVARSKLDSMVQDARARGENPPDMLSWHRLWLARNADVNAAIGQLSARPEVQYVYEVSKDIPPPP